MSFVVASRVRFASASSSGGRHERAEAIKRDVRRELDKILRNMRTATKKFETVHKANLDKLDAIAREDVEFIQVIADDLTADDDDDRDPDPDVAATPRMPRDR